ncbi:MAG: beta-eliminating lyase-related protein, partial [Ilumatobacteraceae bacterium]
MSAESAWSTGTGLNFEWCAAPLAAWTRGGFRHDKKVRLIALLIVDGVSDVDSSGHTERMKSMPVAPQRLFASDNAAGAHPLVLEAMNRANAGHALAYGQDELTHRVELQFNELFDADVRTLFVYGGTGANVMALAAMLKPAEAVVCTSWSHIAVDETGAPERILGAKLIDLPSPDGKLRP